MEAVVSKELLIEFIVSKVNQTRLAQSYGLNDLNSSAELIDYMVENLDDCEIELLLSNLKSQ